MDKELTAIVQNTTAGSTELLLLLNEYFRKSKVNLSEISKLIPTIMGKLGSFAVIRNYILRLQSFVRDNDYEAYSEYITSLSKNYEKKYLNLYLKAKPYLEKTSTVITLSNSHTLFEVFRLWKKDQKNVRIIICESRPKEEGKLFAEKLLKLGIMVQLITEAMMAMYMNDTDAAIIGADQIFLNGDIVNKTGSRTLAVTARYFKKPLYVISFSDKYLNTSSGYKAKLYPPEDVWNFKHTKLKIKNYYFETVEKRLIKKIITV
ncbi:MAG: hypothetical protein Q8933_01670 [Bacteroidota bacterium]|nr:hypothetical protein [Bacteroidota bacterium]MDP4190841.1 hypothetical protein [Bacteroidota bacterium]MDP4193878.1 hypothetical protein [Bacteroidota bacterium]